MQSFTKRAFTLTEVIITLTIIGVLFALYLPTINNDYKKNVTQTTLHDSMKNFNQALFNYSSNMGCNGNLACTNLFTTTNDHSAASKLISSFSSSRGLENGCWDSNVNKPNISLSNYSCVIDAKNVIFATQNIADNSNCNTNLLKTGDGIPQKHKLQKSCGYVYIDTNGKKSPNTFGDDVFVFVITDNAPSYLYPVGGEFWEDNTNLKGANCNGNDGRACAGKIVKDNMKIKY